MLWDYADSQVDHGSIVREGRAPGRHLVRVAGEQLDKSKKGGDINHHVELQSLVLAAYDEQQRHY